MNLKLGRRHPTQAKFKVHHYLGPELPPPPVRIYWQWAMTGAWRVMGNDLVGNCTCAAMGHAIQTITSSGDGLIDPIDGEIMTMYEKIGGYVPGDANTDNGATEVDAMKYMVTTGLAGQRLDAFADVDHRNLTMVKQVMALFGGAYIGVQITKEDMDDFEAGRPWTNTSLANVEGGHALWVPGYDRKALYPLTWGKVQEASWEWFQAKCDEAHACLFFPWVQNSADCNPDNFNLAQLETDIKAV